jgi:hypothetical protein
MTIKEKKEQVELFAQIIELTNQLKDTTLLQIVSDNAMTNINALELKDKILVDNTETYKFDDTHRYDD